MTTKRIVIITIAAVSIAAFGCSEAKPQESEAIERATSKEPTLTSTTAPTPLRPVGEKKIEPSVVEVTETPPTKEDRSIEPTLESADGVSIQRLVTASAIENREPLIPSSVFGHHDEKVYAFVDVSNESNEEKTLLVHFIGPDEFVSGGIELRIPPAVPRWRTWAYTKHAKTPGLWRVEIRDVDGSLLGVLPFEVAPGC